MLCTEIFFVVANTVLFTQLASTEIAVVTHDVQLLLLLLSPITLAYHLSEVFALLFCKIFEVAVVVVIAEEKAEKSLHVC